MTFSSIIAIIGGIVTAGCAIAGAIVGIRARRAQEARNEEIRKAEHDARIQRIKDANNAKYLRNTNVYPTTYQQPVNSEVHHYYHNIPQTTQQNVTTAQTYPTYPQQQYQNYTQNQYMNQYSGYSNYAYGNTGRDTVYPGEREIGNMSKMEMMRNMISYQNPSQSFGYGNYNPQSNISQSFGYGNYPQYASPAFGYYNQPSYGYNKCSYYAYAE